MTIVIYLIKGFKKTLKKPKQINSLFQTTYYIIVVSRKGNDDEN